MWTIRLPGLTALCLLLAAVVAITGERRGVVGRRSIAPGLTIEQVINLEIKRPGIAPIVVDLSAGRARVSAPLPGPADEAVVRDLISALAAARADRVAGDRSGWRQAGLDAPRLTVRIARTTTPIEVRVGAARVASGQVWLGVDQSAMLVPAWVADALDRDLSELRHRRPFTGGRVTGVEIHAVDSTIDLVLAGDPLKRRDDGVSVRVAAGPRDRLLAALSAIELDAMVDGPRDRPVTTMRVLGGETPAELSVYRQCPGHADQLLVDGSAGVGCVKATAVAAVRAATAELAGPSGIARSPLDGVSPRAITIAQPGPGEPLRLIRAGGAWQLKRGAEHWSVDDDAVRSLLDALDQPAVLAPIPDTPVISMWTVDLAGGAVEMWEIRRSDHGLTLRRAGESRALVLGAAASAAVNAVGGSALRSRTLLIIEPTAITRIVASGGSPAEIERGATLDVWRVIVPAGAGPLPAITAITDALATLRATAWLTISELEPVRRTLTITVDAAPSPDAQPTRHTIEIGARRNAGRCAARVDGSAPIELAAADCARLLAPLVR